MAKVSREYKMVSADGQSKLRVYAKEGKRGINVGVTIKDPGVKARTGCQDTFEEADKANNRFNELTKQGEELGWLPRGESAIANSRRSAFTSIPASPGAAPQAVTEKVKGGDVVDPDGFVVDPKEEKDQIHEPVAAGNVTSIGNGKKGKK